MIEIIAGNVCSVCGMISDAVSGTRKKKAHILIAQTFSLVFYGIGSVILKGYSNTAQNAVGVFRNLAAIKNVKSKTLEWTLIALGVILGIYFNNRALIGWLPIIANLEYSVAVFRFKENTSLLKLAFMINALMFAIFNFAIQNYVGTVSCSVVFITTLIALIKEKHPSPAAQDRQEENS